MADEHQRSPARLLRELYFNRTGIVFLMMVLISVLMLFASARTHGSVSQFWLAVGSATLATTGYSFVQVLLTTQQFNQLISNTIQTDVKNEISRSTDEALSIFRSSQTRYLPSGTYPAQRTTNPDFNRDLNRSPEHLHAIRLPRHERPLRRSATRVACDGAVGGQADCCRSD